MDNTDSAEREYIIGQIMTILERASERELRVLLAAARAYTQNKNL